MRMIPEVLQDAVLSVPALTLARHPRRRWVAVFKIRM
jgi:hypothetical protein